MWGWNHEATAARFDDRGARHVDRRRDGRRDRGRGHRTNYETTATTLYNTGGTPLALKASSGHAPLAVNSKVKVPSLNSDLLDGLDSTSLQRRVSGTCTGVSAIRGINASGSVGCSPARESLYLSNATYVVPAGVTRLLIIARGGGGGGGAADGTAGGGGGGQGSLIEVVAQVTPGQSLNIAVGQGGSGGAVGAWPGDRGGNGTATTVVPVSGGDPIVSAANGNGGEGAQGGVCTAFLTNGGPLTAPTLGTVTGVSGETGASGGSDANCTVGGAGGGAGFAGGGGNGAGAGSQSAGSAGHSGLLLIEVIG
jgi:hypothetical protein